MTREEIAEIVRDELARIQAERAAIAQAEVAVQREFIFAEFEKVMTDMELPEDVQNQLMGLMGRLFQR